MGKIAIDASLGSRVLVPLPLIPYWCVHFVIRPLCLLQKWCDWSEIIIYMHAWRWCILFHEQYITIIFSYSACAAPLEHPNVYKLYNPNFTLRILFWCRCFSPAFYKKPRKKQQTHSYHFASFPGRRSWSLHSSRQECIYTYLLVCFLYS